MSQHFVLNVRELQQQAEAMFRHEFMGGPAGLSPHILTDRTQAAEQARDARFLREALAEVDRLAPEGTIEAPARPPWRGRLAEWAVRILREIQAWLG